jgi:hypothetical protein
MSIRTTDRLLAILDAELTLDDIRNLPPAHRRKLAALLYHWHQLAEQKPGPKAGVLAHLNNGGRSE